MYSFFLFFFIAVIALGSVSIGPVSVRVIMSVLMIILLLSSSSDSKRGIPTKYIIVYLIYIFFYGFSLLMNGEFSEHGYIKQVLAFHLVSIILYYACQTFIRSDHQLDIVNYVLFSILILTSITTMLQYYQSPLGWAIAGIFNSGNLEEVIQRNLSNRSETALGRSITTGIFPYVFTNAMFIASTASIPLFYIFKKDTKTVRRFIYIAITALAFMACFMTQQRAAFGLLILSMFGAFLLLGKRKYSWFLLLGIFLLVISQIDFGAMIDEEKYGRIGTMLDFKEDEIRRSLRLLASDFISNNLLWGGPEKYLKLAGEQSHNFFYNAFIYGGLFGGIAVIILFIMMSMRCLLNVFKKNKVRSLSTFYGIGLLTFFMCGFFHNASLVLGSSQIFVLFSLMLVAEKLELNTEKNNIKIL